MKIQSSKEELVEMFRKMSLIRRMEIVADNLYKQRLIRGFCHLYDGQEAVAVGIEAAINYNDYVITSYREHGWQYTRGDTPESILAELMGKDTGCAKGKGGSMHMYYPEHRFFGGNGIVGAQIPLGAGLAFASKYRKDGTCAIALYGDGAANQGQVFEAANMAALWDLPLIFAIENNQYGMGTSVDRAAADPNFYTRGDYIPGIQVDGMDVLAVKRVTEWAKEYCVSGKGPLFIEYKTYRYHGHSMSDPGITYRSRDEVTNVRSTRDCISKLRARILDQGWATEAELKDIEKQIREEIDVAAEKAKAAKQLPPEELYTDIYVGKNPPFVRYPDYLKSKRFE
jgi:pyruvate dehydrogenase E1 component alpha subunit